MDRYSCTRCGQGGASPYKPVRCHRCGENTMETEPNTQDVSDAALIEFSRIKLWFFRDLVDAQRKALFLLCGFSDAVTHGELDTHSAQLRALRHALRIDAARELKQPLVAQGASDVDIAKAQNCIHKIGVLPNLCLRCGWDWYKNGDIPEHPEEAAARKLQQAQPADVWESYKTWPADIRAKLSCHDLRRMSGWAAKSPIADWRIDTSAGGPILVYQNCSVIESEQAQYVLNLIAQDQQAELQQAQVVGSGLSAIGEFIRTQDNRITSHPVFVVEQQRTIYAVDTDYDTDGFDWLDGDGVVSEAMARRLEKLHQAGGDTGKYRRLGYKHYWEFVTACFTEQGCKDYLAVNGHNLKEPRIYVYSAYRNAEWIMLRDFLATPQSSAGDWGACDGISFLF